MQVQDLGGWFGDMLFKLLLLLILMNFSIKINSVFMSYSKLGQIWMIMADTNRPHDRQ
ncbi:hypothetical protein EJK50_1239 [Moraxella catarrhalis]|nr:hypothetical protein EJK50_1239 [Moraxella catarrhalis]